MGVNVVLSDVGQWWKVAGRKSSEVSFPGGRARGQADGVELIKDTLAGTH